MPNGMEKQLKDMYLECSCLPHPLIKDINYFFDIIDVKHAEGLVGKLTLEQIEVFNKLNEIYKSVSKDKAEAKKYEVQILLSIYPTSEHLKLQAIRDYIQKCECPSNVGWKYQDFGSFHNFKSMKNFLSKMI